MERVVFHDYCICEISNTEFSGELKFHIKLIHDMSRMHLSYQTYVLSFGLPMVISKLISKSK